MDAVQPILDWFADHRLTMVFVSSLIDATGLPFPGRILLLLAGTLTSEAEQLGSLIAAGTVGALIGDHALYAAGRLGGQRLLVWYCRLSLASERCLDATVDFFKRFGPVAVMIGRFSFGVRLFAAVLAGAGYLRYWRFVAFDAIGTVFYTSLWLGVGHLFGASVMERTETARLLLLIGPVMIVAVLAFRLARRWRYGTAVGQQLRQQDLRDERGHG